MKSLCAGDIQGHRGYDIVSQVDKQGEESSNSAVDEAMKRLTTISDSFMSELMDFYRPYNERLFEITGKRCDWEY